MSTRKLLLADDSITIQKVVNLTFADEGIEVIAVGNGDSAMEKMAEIKPDLVMADINMPGLNGYQVCERIKQDGNYRQTPVILLVGSFEPFDEEEARRVGADDFLTKPFQSIRQLVNKVTFLLDANDRSAATLYEATANNSFANTLDMETPEMSDSDQASDLGDAGMDDEMIQTNPINSFALDESAKFETKEVAEPIEDLGKTQPLSVYDLKEFSFVAESPKDEVLVYENSDENEPESQNFEESDLAESNFDSAENNDLTENNIQEEKKEGFSSFLDSSEDDLLEIPFDEDEEWAIEETMEEPPTSPTVEETEKEEIEESPTVKTEKPQADEPTANQYESTNEEISVNEEIPELESVEGVSSGEFNEELKTEITDEKTRSPEFNNQFQIQESADEISSPETDSESSIQEAYSPEELYRSENEVVVGSLIEPENESESTEEKIEETTGNQQPYNSLTQFSPELIDAIAQKVIEKLTEQVVREIAWEVVPQHADLIIKKIVEEKLKE